jgi:hypothetical protein
VLQNALEDRAAPSKRDQRALRVAKNPGKTPCSTDQIMAGNQRRPRSATRFSRDDVFASDFRHGGLLHLIPAARLFAYPGFTETVTGEAELSGTCEVKVPEGCGVADLLPQSAAAVSSTVVRQTVGSGKERA